MDKKIKKITIATIISYILYITILLLFFSCGSVKKNSKTNTETKIQNDLKKEKDSSSVTEKNNAINDRIEIAFPKTDNEDLLKLFNEAMKQLNTSKTSGSNSYSSRYDEDLMKWIIDFKVGETINSKTNIKNNSEIKNIKETTIEESIEKITSKIPLWFYILLFIWILPSIIEKINFFINPIKSIINKINEKQK